MRFSKVCAFVAAVMVAVVSFGEALNPELFAKKCVLTISGYSGVLPFRPTSGEFEAFHCTGDQ